MLVLCRPDRFWAERYQEEVFQLLPRFKPQEMANVLWAMAVLNMKLPEVGGVWGRGWEFKVGLDVIQAVTLIWGHLLHQTAIVLPAKYWLSILINAVCVCFVMLYVCSCIVGAVVPGQAAHVSLLASLQGQ